MADEVLGGADEFTQPTHESRFFVNLAPRTLFERLADLELALRQTPVLLVWAVDDCDLEQARRVRT